MKKIFDKFWVWYERHYTINLTVTATLFTLQLFHLYWLTTHVVIHRILGVSLWDPTTLLQNILILVDYTEIPAIVTTSLVYINELRKGFKLKPFLYLLFLDIQLLHIFWITDEFVVEQFSERAETILPLWLAWIAIMIDYLELPVIYETIKKAFNELKNKISYRCL